MYFTSVFRAFCSLILTLAFLLAPQIAVSGELPASRGSVSAQSGTEQLLALLSGIKTFQAGFSQFVVDKNGTVQQTTGTLKAMKPGYFYWHTDPPLEQVIVSDGTTVQVFDPDLEQVTIQKMDNSRGNSPAMLLTGDQDQIRLNYRISLTEKDNYRFFALEPIGKESLFDSLQLKFVDQALVEMRLRDGLGQKTTLSFISSETNLPLTEKDFVLDLPEGVDIISEN
ncbi:MAG: outer membrane lipoprotein carrier protein LolA [Gammaproteobacteria bacterium]|nr:MAG: outer membrane lipoprotein carrier protein LolA [Pseudomonadota bacterium]PIE38035.1 MAG: outer membrane lipoprotein carrier protein LolA [Gammaproteobacteria bacterium]